MSSTRELSGAGLRGKNISKACENCRRRKQKCDGESPCTICRRRGLSCSYREITRSRRPGASEHSQTGRAQSESEDAMGNTDRNTASSNLSEADIEHLKVILPRTHIFNTLRATHLTKGSRSSVSQLSYGPSSNFSLLRHFQVHLDPGDDLARELPESPAGPINRTQSIDKLRYRGRALEEEERRRSLDTTFLPFDRAKAFLDAYLNTTHHQFPILSPVTLQSFLAKLYDTDPTNALTVTDKALILLVLAIGATSKCFDWRTALLAKATNEFDKIRYDVNLQTVQIELLMITLHAICEFVGGSLQLGYQLLGGAVRKAIAAGLHSQDTAMTGQRADPEAVPTFWSVYCYEIFFCFTFGWPPSLRLEDVDVPLPDHNTYLRALFDISDIILQVHRMYRLREATIKSDIRAAYQILKRLQTFLRALKKDLGIVIGRSLQQEHGERFIQQVTLSYQYFYAMCLTFRPALLLSVEIGRRNASVGAGAKDSALHNINATIQDAGERCIDAARSMIIFSQTLFALSAEAEAVCNHELFAETACFVLILAILRDKSSYSSHASYIRSAIKCLQQMSPRKRLEDLIIALEELLIRVKDLPSVGPSPNTEADSVMDQTMVANQPSLGLAQDSLSSIGFPATFSVDNSLPEDLDPQFGNALWGIGQAEQTLQSLEQLPDAAWPYMDWNTSLSNFDFNSYGSQFVDPSVPPTS